MKKIITLIFIAFSTIAVNAQKTTTSVVTANPADVKPTPPVETLVLKESEFNFGKIPQGKPVTHIFEVTNKSNIPLKIYAVKNKIILVKQRCVLILKTKFVFVGALVGSSCLECVECCKDFSESYLFEKFSYPVCDGCK